MTEQERIDKNRKNIQLLEEKKKAIEELAKNEIIVKYLNLLEEIEILNKKIGSCKNLEQATELEFNWAFRSRIKNEGITPCSHDVWMYCGSYGMWLEPKWRRGHEYFIKDEEKKEFSYNKYSCLECNKVVHVSNWQEFEQNNRVLKNRNDIDVEKYRRLYYQLLYNYSVEESQKILFDKFKENNIFIKKKIKKNN